jgi:tripartite-type tricarboxylate transporter receptor subunit TctC
MRTNGRLGVLMSIGLAASAMSTTVAAQDSVADFYKGKRVTILVGFTAGGSSSLYAQSLARHMGRYLPGNPEMLVQNMPGAGGLVVANHVYNSAPRDGTVFAITGRTAAIEPLLGNKNAKFDAQKFNWIGTANVEYTTCIAWHTAPVKTLADAMQKELIVGGSGSDATEVVFPKAANKLAGTKFKVVTGYHGSTEINLAMERGEVQGFCGIGWTFLKLRKTAWLKEKKVNILFQLAMRKHPDLPDVPLIIDHAKTPEGKKIFEFLFAPQEMGRPFFAPPGVPAERVQALRDAFEKTLKDPQYLAEAAKLGIEVQYVGGEAIHALLARVYGSPKELIEQARAVAR